MPINSKGMHLVEEKRRGQAFLIVVIIIAVIISIFTIGVSNSIRSSALEGTEIYQREQALYVAECGINQMIYNINNGTTYTNGQSITGNTISNVGSYTTYYYTSDTFGGNAKIMSVGKVGNITRTIYVSLVSGGDPNTYKYCMFSGGGGEDSLYGTSYFNNSIYTGYFYNSTSSNIPTVNFDSFWKDGGYTLRTYTSNYLYTPANGDKVCLHYSGGGSATLTINPTNVSCSIITDFPNVTVSITDVTPSSIPSGVSDNFSYPLIVHISPNGVSSSFNCGSGGNGNLVLNGLIFTNATFSISYSGQDKFTLNGMLIAGKLGNIAPHGNATFKINYNTDFVTKPPLYFSTSGPTKVLVPSYREDY